MRYLKYFESKETSQELLDKYADDIVKVITIFFKINFEEVFGRVKDLGFESYAVNGVKNGSSENMTIEFWKPLPKDDEDNDENMFSSL